MSPTLQTIKNAVENGHGKHLGSIFWWMLWDNVVSHATLENLAKQHGLPDKYLPNEVKKLGAFKRAVRRADNKRAKEHKTLMIRDILDNADEFTVGIVKEDKDTQRRDLDYNTLAKVTFNKHSDRITTEGDHPLIKEIERLYYIHLDHDTNDVRVMMTSFLKEAGVAIRPSGGIYFVPEQHQKTLDAMCAVVGACSNGNQCFQLAINDNANNKQNLATVAQAGLEEEIRQIQSDLDTFDFEKAKDSTLSKKLANFENLRARAMMLSNVLNFKMESINQKLDGVKTKVKAHVANGSAATTSQPKPKVTPKKVEPKPEPKAVEPEPETEPEATEPEPQQNATPDNGTPKKKPGIIWTEDATQDTKPEPSEPDDGGFNWDDVEDDDEDDDTVTVEIAEDEEAGF